MSSSPSQPASERKRRRSSSVDKRDVSPQQSNTSVSYPPPLAALPPPMIPNPAATPASPIGVAYYPVYTTHSGHFYIASPPLHPTSMPTPSPSSSSSSHPTKILPKLPHSFQTPPSPATLPVSPGTAPYPFYHPYQPPPTPPTSLQPTYQYPPPTTADQREQARKVSHSAIERRRRERINDKIMQLKQLIPTCADQENLHKMSILQSAIDYITYLKEIVEPIQPAASKKQKRAPKEKDATNTKQPQDALKPKDLFLSNTASSHLPTPALTPPPPSSMDVPTNMSVKNLLC